VLRGTPLTTPDGREVAVAADVIEVPPPLDGQSSCFDARLTMYRLEDPPQSSVPRTTRLCAAASHIDGVARAPATPVAAVSTAAPPDVARPPADAKRTAKGVWYRVLAPGKGGRTPRPTDRIKVHYTGWTTDGKMFDSSQTRGSPAVFPLNGLIAGWVDGMQLMTVGMKARLWIPEELAYKGSPGKPAGMLVFDVELIEIQ
jgi:peptidylprolyl isomerase